jgi:Ca2+-binding EF-hand superfamily protein
VCVFIAVVTMSLSLSLSPSPYLSMYMFCVAPLFFSSADGEGEKFPWTEFKKPEFALDQLQHTKPMPGAVWRDRTFIGQFADVFVDNAETEGGDRKRAGEIHAVIQVIHHIMETVRNDHREWLSVSTDDDLKAIDKTLELFKASYLFAQQAAQVKTPDDFSQFLYVFKGLLSDLRVGDRIVIPGGWRQVGAGHSVIHTIIRSTTDTFAFCVHNTGKGVDYHPSSASSHPKMKYQTTIKIDNIPRDHFMDDAFWYLLFKIQIAEQEDHRPEILYDVLLPHLAGKPLAVALQEQKEDVCIEFRTPQRSETNFTRGVLEAMRYSLRASGLDRAQIKQLFFAMRKQFLIYAEADMHQVQGLLDSDVRLIHVACQQTARAAIKECDAKRLSGVELANVNHLIDRLDSLAKTRSGQGRPIPELTMELSAKWTAFPGAGMLPRELGVEQFAGWKKASTHNKLIDFTRLNRRCESFEHVLEVLELCVELCNSVSAKQDTASSYFFRCSLIQTLVSKVLPAPLPVSLREHCVYAAADVDYITQLKALKLLHEITKHYCAAAKSIDSNPSFRGAQALVMFGLVAIADAFIRIEATDMTSMLSMVLNGTEFSRAARPPKEEDAKQGDDDAATAGDSAGDADTVTPDEAATNTAEVANPFAEPEPEPEPEPELEPAPEPATAEEQPESAADKKKDETKRTIRPPPNIVFYLSTQSGGGVPISLLTEQLQVIEPELTVLRGQVMEYFNAQERLGSMAIFNFPSKINTTTYMGKDDPTLALVRHLCLLLGYDLVQEDEKEDSMDAAISFIESATWYLTNVSSPLLENHPEFAIYRDIVILYKMMLADTDHRRSVKLSRWNTESANNAWTIKEVNRNKTQVEINVASFGQPMLYLDNKPQASVADVQFYIPDQIDPTEDDVLHLKNVPTFDDTLSAEDSEQLLSCLTVPYVRMPLVVAFFATKDRVSFLLNRDIQRIVEKVVFEPRTWVTMYENDPINRVPTPNPKHIGAPFGFLLNEVHHSPSVLLDSLLRLGALAMELNTGSYTSTSTSIILFVIRLLARVKSFIVYVIDNEHLLTSAAPDSSSPVDVTLLELYRARFGDFMLGYCRPILEEWELQTQKESDLKMSCVFNAHLALMYRSMRPEEMTAETLRPFLSHLSFLQTWYSAGLGQGKNSNDQTIHGIRGSGLFGSGFRSFGAQADLKSTGNNNSSSNGDNKDDQENKGTDGELPLFMPDQEVFDMLERHRLGIIKWFREASDHDKNYVLTGLLGAATRARGLDIQKWTKSSDDEGLYASENKDIEIDVLTADVFFRASHIEPVPNYMARTHDFGEVFGEDPQHCALVASHDNRTWVRLVGKSMNLRHWNRPEKDIALVNLPFALPTPPGADGERWLCFGCGKPYPLQAEGCGECKRKRPPHPHGFKWMDVEYGRAYIPLKAIVGEHERWVFEAFEPVLYSIFGGRPKVPFDIFMPTRQLSGHHGECRMLALHGTTWKEFVVQRDRGVVSMYVLLEHGRRMYRSLEFTSNTRFCLHHLPPNTDDRANPWHPSVRYAAGDMKVKTRISSSLVISRDDNEDDIEETFTPTRLLQGVLPSALLDNFHFWQADKDDSFRGLPKNPSDPQWAYRITARLVRLDDHGRHDVDSKTASGRRRWHAVVYRSKLTTEDMQTETAQGNFFDIKKELNQNDPLIAAINKSKMSTLVDMGYSTRTATEVLQTYDYDLPLAQSWLADPANAEAIAELEMLGAADDDSDDESTGGLAAPTLVRQLSERQNQAVLLNLLHTPPGSLLHRMCNVLTRVEDVSYILAWTSSAVERVNDDVQVSLIELPRLKLKFQPRRDRHGVVRLYSLDHEGLYVSDYRDTHIDRLVEGIPHCLLMSNEQHELSLLVPNIAVHRPIVLRCPFSTELVLDRCEEKWQQVMESRFFLYPVHPSHTFLVTPTQGSAVYLILLRMLARRYVDAFRVVQSCEADMKLTASEAWLVDELGKAAYDFHPDAHACRLKLSIVMMHCRHQFPWFIQDEYSQYLSKLNSVSSACRLSVEEEIYLLKHVKSGIEFEAAGENKNELSDDRKFLDTELSNRLSYLTVQVRDAGDDVGDDAGAGSDDSITFMQRKFQRGGETKWNTVENSAAAFYGDFTHESRTWYAKLEYYRPDQKDLMLGGAVRTMNRLWQDTITGMGEHHLGFLLLYEMMTGSVRFTLTNPANDNSRTLAKLMAQVLFLKNSLWGTRTDLLQLHRSYEERSMVPYILLALVQNWPDAEPSPTKLPYDMYRYDLSSGVRVANRGEEEVHPLAYWLDQLMCSGIGIVNHPARLEKLQHAVFHMDDMQQVQVPPLSQVKPLPEVEDAACVKRTLRAFYRDSMQFSVDDVGAMSNQPLAPVQLHKFVTRISKEQKVANQVKFDVSDLPDAQSHVAKSLLSRLKKDTALYAEQANSGTVAYLVGLLEEDIHSLTQLDAKQADFGESERNKVQTVVTNLTDLVNKLHELRDKDEEQVPLLMDHAVSLANYVELGVDVLRHEALQSSGAGATTQDSGDEPPLNRRVSSLVTADDDEELVELDDSDSDTDSEAEPASASTAVATSSNSNSDVKTAEPIRIKCDPNTGECGTIGGDGKVEEEPDTPETIAAKNKDLDRYRFFLSRFASLDTHAWMGYLSACLVSKDPQAHLRKLNPYLAEGATEPILDAVTAFCLRVNRIGHVNRCVAMCVELMDMLRQTESQITSNATNNGERFVVHKSLYFKSTALAKSLSVYRYSVGQSAGFDNETDFDPRFVLFEYLFNILLRKQQVRLVNSFVDAKRKGDSMVQQMIMGAGKTTVIGPLLALILADGEQLVTMVVPGSLLEFSRGVMRSRFTRVISKRIHTFSFDRSCRKISTVTRLFDKLNMARRTRGIVVTTPEAIKSLMLKMLELLHQQDDAPAVLSEQAQTRLKVKSRMADELAPILKLWRSGTLIMDEVDLLLHPLRSELNFPIGPKQPLDLSPDRWELPIHLLDAIYFAELGEMSVDFGESRTAWDLLKTIKAVVQKGIRQRYLQTSPHLVLLDPHFYQAELKQHLAAWVLLWLRSKQHVMPGVEDSCIREYLCHGPSSDSKILELVQSEHNDEQRKMLNLAHDWVHSYAPHVLAKINRVSYGLLTKDDLKLVDENMAQSRRLMAVPFVGKDVPSHASEFAHPDVLVGLTILAYRYEGVRLSDLTRIVGQLQRDMRNEIGPMTSRPASVLFEQWCEKGEDYTRVLERKAMERQFSDDERKQFEAKLKEEAEHPHHAIVPLPIFQLSDDHQVSNLFRRVRRLPDLVHYYLEKMVFPDTMQHQVVKLSASGQELGGDILFSQRFGFSGTPSDLLPLELGDCQYEKGSEGKIMNVLTDESIVSYVTKDNWSVKQLLRDIATRDPPAHALIDTGALITGMTNFEVAQFLLDNGLAGMEGVVFLDRMDRQMILLRSTGKVLPLAQCGVSLAKRFSFYDQVHTTGMDIKQTLNATAVLTIGKDMTFRDYSQGAYRMRGIGQGQTIELIVIPEVAKLVQKEVPQTDSIIVNIAAWLTVNSMRSEKLQFMQLCLQNLTNIWRKHAFSELLNESLEADLDNRERYWRFQTDDSKQMNWLRRCVSLFREQLDFAVQSDVSDSTSFLDNLTAKADVHRDFINGRESAETALATVSQHAAGAGVSSAASALQQRSLNSEMVQEAEQEAEKQKDKRVQQEQQVQVRYSREDEHQIPWPVHSLSHLLLPDTKSSMVGSDATEMHPFYPYSRFSVRGAGLSDIHMPSHVLLSHNYFRPEWAAMGQRRLKNVAVVLDWMPQRPPLKRTASAISASQLSEAQELALQQAYKMFDFDGTGAVSTHQLRSIMRSVGENPQDEELEELRVSVDKDNTGKIEYGAFRELILSHTDEGRSRERYFVCISLAEAQTLRRLIHRGNALINTAQQPASFGLRLLNGSLLDASKHYTPPRNDAELNMALQCFRFVNCEFFFDDNELSLLLRALATNRTVVRRSFFENLLRCRRRDRRRWNDTPLSRLFVLEDEYEFFSHRAKVARINNAIERKDMLLQDAFTVFDAIGDGMLSATELAYACQWLGIDIPYEEVVSLVRQGDKDEDGLLNVHEFTSMFYDQYSASASGNDGDDGIYSITRSTSDYKSTSAGSLPALQRPPSSSPPPEPVKKYERLQLPADFLERYKKEEAQRRAHMERLRMEAAERQAQRELEEQRRHDEEKRKAAAFLERQALRKLQREMQPKKWACPMCTWNNEANRPSCEMCQSARPAESKRGPDEDLDEDLEEDELPFWTCSACTLQNSRENNMCEACMSPKPQVTKTTAKVVDVSIWWCDNCLRGNLNAEDTCGVCDTSRPS